MHLLEKPIDYSKVEEFSSEVNRLSLDDAKKLVKKLYEDNRNYKQVAARAAITIDQYKCLLAVFDGYSENKENLSEVGLYFKKMLVATADATKHLAFWVDMLCEAAKRIVFEDPVVQEIFGITGDVCRKICKATITFKPHKVLLPDEPNGIRVKNLERTEDENAERGFYSHQSSLINNRGEKSKDKIQKDGEKHHSRRGESTLKDRNSVQDDDARCDEESGSSSLKQSASTCENDFNEGGENRCVRNEVACEKPEKRKEKTFGISYLKSQNLFKNDMIQNKKLYSNISVKCNENKDSTAFDELTQGASHINKGNQSFSADENDTNEDDDSNYGLISSKGRGRYKRKHSLNTNESNLMKKRKYRRKSNTSQNSEPVTKRSRKYRRSNSSNLPENYDDVKGIDESETTTLQSSSSLSKRYQKSNKYQTSNTEENELIESSSGIKGKNLKKFDSCLTSETEAEDVIPPVKPKKNRRGRKKKQTVTPEQETSRNYKYLNKDESFSLENVPLSPISVTKSAYVRLTDVLDDPEAQHYPDVIQCKERLEKEAADGSRCDESNEIEEATLNKERDEMEALQEWSVLDAVSDEEDKEFDSMEDIEESSNNNDNQQTSDSEVEEQQTVNDDDREQPENYDSDKELDFCNSAELDESCPSKHDNDINCNSSDREIKEPKKGPSTPDVSPHESDLEDNSDVQDEKDADADSVKSNEDEDISSRSPASGSSIYGKKGPRTPPSPAPFEPLRRGPQTPPGNGPDSEVIDDEENGSEYSSD